MADPATVANLLQSTLTGTTETIKAAEQGLELLQQDHSFLPQLLFILKQPNYAQTVRKAAAVYIKKYIRNKLIEKDQNVINSIAELLLNELSVSTVEMGLRKHLAYGIEYVLMNDHKGVVREKLGALCRDMMDRGVGEDSGVNYEFLGYFSNIMMASFLHLTKEISIFMQDTLVNFARVSLKIVKYAQASLNNRENLLQTLRILKLYSSTFKLYTKKIMLTQIQTVKLLYSQPVTMLISTGLDFILPNNTLATHLLYSCHGADQEVTQLFHSIKGDYVQGLCYYTRAIFIQFKDHAMIKQSPVLNNHALIPSFVGALQQMLASVPYHRIKSAALVTLMQQMLNFLTITVRNSFYFTPFLEAKEALIHGVLLRVLAFSPVDCTLFCDDAEEFRNGLLQIVEDGYLGRDRTTESPYVQGEDEVEEYRNLRTLGAVLLAAYCKNIESSLPEIITFSFGILSNTLKSQFPKSLLLLMLSILREEVVARPDDSSQLITLLASLLSTTPIPPEINDSEATPIAVYESNIEYQMMLVCVYRYLSKVQQLSEGELQSIYQAVHAILVRENVSKTIRMQAFDLTISIATRDPKYEVSFLVLLNDLLKRKDNIIHTVLQTLCNLIKLASLSLAEHRDLLVSTVHNLAQSIYTQVSKPKDQYNQLTINKCWNTISDIAENEAYIPALIPDIEGAVMPLLGFIDGVNNYDYEENILMMMSSFIEKSQSVTQNQLAMFQIIPKLFYNSYEMSFCHAFQTLNVFIYYGSHILASAPQAITAIVQMATCRINTVRVKDRSRNEAQNCEGVMILQSLMLSCGNAFTSELWVEVAKVLTTRLQNPPVKGHILHSNILAALAVVVMLGHKCFSPEDCDILLNKIIQNHYCFVVRYSNKLAVIALAEILTYTHLPFVLNRFTYLLDTIVMLLEAQQNKNLFEREPMTQEQKDYDASVETIINLSTKLDEIEHFKKKMTAIKEKNLPLLQKTLSELPDRKAEFLRKTMSVSKINNDTRVIFKIKK